MDIERILKNFKEGKFKIRDAQARMKKRLPDVLHKPVLAELMKLHKKEKSYRLVWLAIQNEINTYLDHKKAEKPERQPKFEAPLLWDPVNLKMATADQWEVRDEVDGVIRTYGIKAMNPPTDPEAWHAETSVCFEPDVVWMRFDTKGPSGKLLQVTCTLEEYLGMVVLHYFPKAMPLIMKAAKGELTAADVDFNTLSFRKFITDPYEKFDRAALRHPADRVWFCYLCRRILAAYERTGVQAETVLDWVYNSGYTSGQRVAVYIPEDLMWYEGEVISDAGQPLEVRYDEGVTGRVGKSNQVIPLNKKTKAKA